MLVTRSLLGLLVLLIAGCGRPVPSILVINDSKSPVNVVTLEKVDHFERTEVLAGETKSVVSRAVVVDQNLTIGWYIVGAAKALPAIKKKTVSIPQDWDGFSPLKLSFNQQREWSASF